MEDKDLARLVREFVEALGLYLRQQGQELVTQITLQPLRRAGGYLLLLTAVAALLVLGLAFLGIGIVMALARAVGGFDAAFVLGGVGLLVAAFVAYWLGTQGKRGKGAAKHGEGQ